MEIVLLCGLIVIVFVLFAFLYIQFKMQRDEAVILRESLENLRKHYDVIEKKFEQVRAEVQEDQQALYHKWEKQKMKELESMQETNYDFLHKLEDQFVTLVEDFNERNEKQFKAMLAHFNETLDQELRADEDKVQSWIAFVEGLGSNEEKIEALEASINQHSYSKLLVTIYMDTIRPLFESENSLVKKRALERANRVARTFLDNCDVADYPVALSFYRDIVERGNQFMTSSYEKRVEQARSQLAALERKVTELESSDPAQKDGIIAELEELERKLDQGIVEKVAVLRTEYQKISKRIIAALAEDQDEELVKQYNVRAIFSLQRLHNDFTNNQKAYRSGKVAEISRVLGMWDTSYFTPQTNTYYQFVYGEIFNNLVPTEKPLLTELVVKMEKKRVG